MPKPAPDRDTDRAADNDTTPGEPGSAAHKPTLAQSVTERLRDALLEGRFAPDEKLYEESLGAMLQVSRTPVRTALHSLASQGLLDYFPNRGYSVRSMDVRALNALLDLRGVLEGLAARLAAEQGMTSEQQGRYRTALEQGDKVLTKGRLVTADRTLFSDINSQLHTLLVEAADNRMLEDMLRMCRDIPASSDRNVLWDDYEWLRRSHDDHHRLFEAVLLRDGPRAERLMREHVHSIKLKRLVRHEVPQASIGVGIGVGEAAAAPSKKKVPRR